MAHVPLKLGPFEPLHRLGAGGMAETFVAVRRGPAGFEQRVCIKRILPAYEADQDFVQAFLAEARTSAQLRHTNIVQVLDFGLSEPDGSHYLALELIDGLDLRALLQREGTLDPDLVTLIASELAAALEHAHADDEGRLPVVHRDLSPSNVLVSRAGEIKLTDFGIARVVGGSHRTASGVIKGKIPYMPPEYIETSRFDARGDLFALGVLLYELCHGHRPFDGDSELDTLRKIAAGDRRPFEAAAPPALVACIDRLLQREPEARFESARALLDALPHVPVNALRKRLAAMVRARSSLVSPLDPALALVDGKVPRTLVAAEAVHTPGPQISLAPTIALPEAALASRTPSASPTARSMGPSRKSLIALAASLLVLSGVLALGLLRGGSPPSAHGKAPPQLPTLPAAPAPAPAPRASPEPTAPVAMPAPVEASESEQVKPAEGQTVLSEPDPSSRGTMPAVDAGEPRRAARTSTQPAEVYVVVYPFGDVWVDDKHAGQSPLSLRLAPGTHEIAVGEGRARDRQTIRVRAGESRNLTFRSPPPSR